MRFSLSHLFRLIPVVSLQSEIRNRHPKGGKPFPYLTTPCFCGEILLPCLPSFPEDASHSATRPIEAQG